MKYKLIMPRKAAWTDDQLRAAVPRCSSFFQVLRELGLSGRGASHWTIKARVQELGLDTSHFVGGGPRRSWTDDQVRSAIAGSRSYVDALRALGAPVVAAMHNRIRRDARKLGASTGHFTRERNVRPRRWTDEQLRGAVSAARSTAGTLRALGLVPAGGNYDQVNRRIRDLALDTTHFTGGAWNVGKAVRPGKSTPLELVLVADRETSSHLLKKRLFREGLKRECCELCGWAQRAPDGRLPLELDHMNGDKTDNRIDNLRVLCPNCHALQPTHRGLNKRSLRLGSGSPRRIRTDT